MEKLTQAAALSGLLATGCGQYTCPTTRDVSTESFAAEGHFDANGQLVGYSHFTGDRSTDLNPGGINITLHAVPSQHEEVDAALNQVLKDVQNAWLTPLKNLGVELTIGDPTEEVDCETLFDTSDDTENPMALGDIWACGLPIAGSTNGNLMEKEPCSFSILRGVIGVNEMLLNDEDRAEANLIVSQEFAHTLGLHPFSEGLLSYSPEEASANSYAPDSAALQGLECLYYNPEKPYVVGYDFQAECAPLE